MKNPEFKVDLNLDNEIAVLSAEGHFSEVELRDFESNLNTALSKERIIVDLADLDYICSWGFGIMVDKSQTAQESGGNIVFVKPSNKLYRLFEMLQLDKILKFVDSREEAVEILEND